jgi:hypothetical protein
MSHVTGTIQTLSPFQGIGPDFGINTLGFLPADAPAPTIPPGGIKFVLLHFSSAVIPAGSRLEVDLGYDTDVFTSADGPDFWTRPANVRVFPDGRVPIRFIPGATPTGGVRLVAYGRGERHAGDQDPTAYSNSDPFLIDTPYTEAKYDPTWFCVKNPPTPNWENVARIPAGDIRLNVARSVCMIVSVHGNTVSTCSGTLVGPDVVITAAHCLEHPADEIPTSSVTFDYQTDAAGSRPAGYNPRFFKVKQLIKMGNPASSNRDYSFIQLTVPPGGLGIPPVTMRPDLPAVGEQVFGVHHPNGAVKKLSRPHDGFLTVFARPNNTVEVKNLDVSGGSSGSGLFDNQGRLVGVLSRGFACDLLYSSTATILPELTELPPAAVRRNVMLVFDRSGSMSELTATGRTKIEEARDAAALFVSLVRTGQGDAVGLVSFATSASSPVDFSLAPVTAASKSALIGPSAPFTGGVVGGLAPGGVTSIGSGLQSAQNQFPLPGPAVNRPTILLLTDGLQNTPPMIANVEAGLAQTDLFAIGFGTEANLDGALLTRLTRDHRGMYARAANGLQLKKFFALCFGNIFETGTLLDPEFTLKPEQESGAPLPFRVCGETQLTVVLGWDNEAAPLFFSLKTPSGVVINPGSPDVVQEFGRTWTYMRLALPYQADQDGQWEALVIRVGGGEFPPARVEVSYFINITVEGGPTLQRLEERRAYFTGDVINPLVLFQDGNGLLPHGAAVQLTVHKPGASVGNILSASGLRPPADLQGDTIPARYATLTALEVGQGGPLVPQTVETFELYNDFRSGQGNFEPTPAFGRPLEDLLRHEGNYTFHARATFGEDCSGTREFMWSIHVDTAVDPGQTGVVVTPRPGAGQYTIVLTPRDRYGNLVGPGRLDVLVLTGLPGTTITDGPRDNGDGTYSVDVQQDPGAGGQPGVIVNQPDRPPVVPGGGGVTPDCRDTRRWLRIWMLLALLLLVLLLICWLS